VNAADQVFGKAENGELGALRYEAYWYTPQEVAPMLAELVPMGSRVLDVGCGTGGLSLIIADARKAKVIGIEPNGRRAAAARARGLEVHQELFTPEVL